MGIRKFFKKVGGWVKDKFHAVKNGVTKFAQKAAPVVKKVVNFVDKTPIGAIANSFTGGMFSKAKDLINMLPEGKVKDTVSNFTNKAEQFKDKAINEIDKRQEQARGLIDKGRNALDKGKAIYDKGRELVNEGQKVIANVPKMNM